jgi:hypothetical protein
MKQITIDRLELDLRGVAQPTAQAASRLIGPALARALQGRHVVATGATAVNGGRIAMRAAPDAGTVSERIAQRVALKISRSRS